MLCCTLPLSLNIMSKACLLVLLFIFWFGFVLLPRLFSWIALLCALLPPLQVFNSSLPNHKLETPRFSLEEATFPLPPTCHPWDAHGLLWPGLQALYICFSGVIRERLPPCRLSPSLPWGKRTLVVCVISILISISMESG